MELKICGKIYGAFYKLLQFNLAGLQDQNWHQRSKVIFRKFADIAENLLRYLVQSTKSCATYQLC